MSEQKPKIIVIVGPTATGKSDLAVSLARRHDGEIISADSRQVYRGLDIGTGKITKREMKGVRHHLLDIASPKRTYTVAHFQRDGKKAIRDIVRRGKLPIIVGGTGFYVDALVTDMKLPSVKPDMNLRKKLARSSPDELFQMITRLDPERAGNIDRQNPVRLIRAIEIATHFGPTQPVTTTTPYDPLWIGLAAEKSVLSERIHVRLVKRMKQGMLAEFKKARAGGLTKRRMEMLGLEYRYGARLIDNEIDRPRFMKELEQEIVKYAKRQMTWFKRNRSIHWFDISEIAKVSDLTDSFLQ